MDTSARRATVALWSLPGLGGVTLEALRQQVGDLGALLEVPVARWTARVPLKPATLDALGAVPTLAAIADALERRLAATRQELVFPGDRAWPSRLDDAPGMPPCLFKRGPGAASGPRRRAAIVGTRHPLSGALEGVLDFARALSRAGVGIVSGAAIGVDQAAHRGALAADGETWAFLGSALDQIDAAQRRICHDIVAHGGTVWSQFPPGARSNEGTFVQRNAVISAAADAVVVARAPNDSGARHTARAALAQGRPLLCMPGSPWDADCALSNQLLREGVATAAWGPAEVLRAVGLEGAEAPVSPARPLDLGELGEAARRVYEALAQGPLDLDALVAGAPGLGSGQVAAAVLELELSGAVVQKTGRRYERV